MGRKHYASVWEGSTYEVIPADPSHRPRTRYVGVHEGEFAAAIVLPAGVSVVGQPNADVIVTGMSQEFAERVARSIQWRFSTNGGFDDIQDVYDEASRSLER